MRVRVLTFNVWFEPVHMEVRMEAIGRVVERTRPAVIGFQELTRESLAMLRRQRWAAFYDCSVDAAPPCSEAYFVALFSALPVLEIHALPFANSGMGRELVAVRVELAPGKSLIVGTSHLESMPESSRARVAQLRESMHFLEELVESSSLATVGAVFMGDTNLMRADLRVLDPKLGRVAGKLEVEHAKSSRSKCRSCDETIPKGEVRVGKIGSDQLPDGRHIQLTMWFHRRCFLGRASIDEKRVIESFVQRVAESDAKTSPTAATLSAVAATNPAGVDLATLGLPKHWKDLWLSVSGNTDENGYTFDGRENGHVTSRAFRNRLDRVFFYPGVRVREDFAASSRVVLQDIQIVGKEPISATLWPSDHFGVLASFDFDTGEENSGRAANATAAGAHARALSTSSPAVVRQGGQRTGASALRGFSSSTTTAVSAPARHGTPPSSRGRRLGHGSPSAVTAYSSSTPSRGHRLGHGSPGNVGASTAAVKYEAFMASVRQLGSALPVSLAAAVGAVPAATGELRGHRLGDSSSTSSTATTVAAVKHEAPLTEGRGAGSSPSAKKRRLGSTKETALTID